MLVLGVFLITVTIHGCDGFSVVLRPPRVRVHETRNTIGVFCNADSPISACQFSVTAGSCRSVNGHVFDLSLGANSRANPTQIDKRLLNYRYNGRGLDSGDCGITLETQGELRWAISCRVRKEGGGWVYRWTDINTSKKHPLPSTVEQREVIAVPGGQARFLIQAHGPLGSCHFFVQGGRIRVNLSQGGASNHSRGHHLYYGAGLEEGECGLALSKIHEKNNGYVGSGIKNPLNTSVDWRMLALIIARRPTPPVLNVNYEYGNVTATCTVQDSRPAPNITWMLGAEVIRQDSLDDTPGMNGDSWRWPWMAGSTTQRITRRLRQEDTEKELKCSVSHVTLARPLVALEVI